MAIDDISIFTPQFGFETKLSLYSPINQHILLSLFRMNFVGIDIENVGYSTVSGKIYIG